MSRPTIKITQVITAMAMERAKRVKMLMGLGMLAIRTDIMVLKNTPSILSKKANTTREASEAARLSQ